MRVNTNLELNITIRDIDEIYTRNYNDMLLHHAKLIYEKKCFKNMFIDTIHRIIKRSLPTIIKRDIHHCKFRVYVIFDVDIIKYDELDTIVGVKVMDIIQKGRINQNQDMIICKNDHATILINQSDQLASIEKNQIIPIIVGGINYNILKPTILINAYPFIPIQKKQIIYKIDTLTPENIQYLKEYVYTKLNAKVDDMKKFISVPNQKKRWDYFVDLLYPYKKGKKESTTNRTGTPISIFDTSMSGYVMLMDRHPMDALECIIVDEAETYVVEKAINVYEIFVMEFIKYLEVVQQLASTYLEESVFNSHQNIFNIYLDNKYE